MDNCNTLDNIILLEDLSNQRTPKKRKQKEKKTGRPIEKAKRITLTTAEKAELCRLRQKGFTLLNLLLPTNSELVNRQSQRYLKINHIGYQLIPSRPKPKLSEAV